MQSQQTIVLPFKSARLVTPKVHEDMNKTILHPVVGDDIKWYDPLPLILNPSIFT